MIVLMTMLIAGLGMAFAVHQWWRGYHMVAIGFITFAWLMAGVAIEAAKNNQNAEATEVFSAAIADQLSRLITSSGTYLG
jgi:glucose uptake protein GlcU